MLLERLFTILGLKIYGDILGIVRCSLPTDPTHFILKLPPVNQKKKKAPKDWTGNVHNSNTKYAEKTAVENSLYQFNMKEKPKMQQIQLQIMA